jgi:hypothetical protein
VNRSGRPREVPPAVRLGAGGAAPAAHDPERTMRTCPICGKELAERRCKLYCPDPVCGYFLSCADYY